MLKLLCKLARSYKPQILLPTALVDVITHCNFAKYESFLFKDSNFSLAADTRVFFQEINRTLPLYCKRSRMSLQFKDQVNPQSRCDTIRAKLESLDVLITKR